MQEMLHDPIFMYGNMYVYTYSYIHTCYMYISTYIHIYIYIYVHMHINPQGDSMLDVYVSDEGRPSTASLGPEVHNVCLLTNCEGEGNPPMRSRFRVQYVLVIVVATV